MKKRTFMSRAAVLCALVFTLALLLFPVGVLAASSSVHNIDITVDLNEDGSAHITEVWNMDTGDDITEWYLGKDLEYQTISNLAVSDDAGRVYENIGAWDVDASFDEKAGKCGIVTTASGYELCWGITEYGTRTYIVQYDITNLVKSYDTADAIGQYFVSSLAGGADSVTVTIQRPDRPFTQENTGVWGFGHTGEIFVEDGRVVSRSTQRLRDGEYVAILVEFAKGMFNPAFDTGESFDEFREEGMLGSNYQPDENYEPNNNSGGIRSFFSNFAVVVPFLFMGIWIAIIAAVGGAKRKGGANVSRADRARYREAEYSRELPWNGSLPATYARLGDIGELENEGVIIGAHLLRWVRNRQVELVTQKGGFFGNKDEVAIKLYTPRTTMDPQERQLYDMLVAAAGPDWVLQNKEFEKWSRRNYTKVEGWLEQCKNSGKSVVATMGGSTVVPTEHFFGLFKSNKTVITPLGEQLTEKMMGFKKYLKDFTIINEREAREVQLWDEYLVFAQLFGIAEAVAEQFKEVYPNYFQQVGTELGMGANAYDILWITHMANSYSRAAYNGYRAGYNAAHSSSYSGGGGGFSGGGGGGFSGGGSSGGR